MGQRGTETMLVVNAGKQAITKGIIHPDGFTEEITFHPNVVVRCSVEMGEYLVKKFSDPLMAVFFREAEGEALARNPSRSRKPVTASEQNDVVDEDDVNDFSDDDDVIPPAVVNVENEDPKPKKWARRGRGKGKARK